MDLGCGDGSFLAESAAETPGHNFLGVERLLGRARKACKKAARSNLTNVRVIRLESAYTLRYLLPPSSVQILHVGFPDPWPKARHHKRRLVNRAFLDAAASALCVQGEIRCTTDHMGYKEWIEETVASHPLFRLEPWQPPDSYPQTDFEREFRESGVPVFHIRLVRDPH